MITLLIVDEQPAIRLGLRMRFALEDDLAIAGEAGDAGDAIALGKRLHPDVIVIDIAMPDIDGVEVIRILRTVAPDSAIVVLSLRDDPATRGHARAAGACDFIAKYQPDAQLLDAIRAAASTLAPASCAFGAGVGE